MELYFLVGEMIPGMASDNEFCPLLTDARRVHIWKMSSSSSDIGYGLTCTAKIFTGHTNNIFSVQTLKNSNRIATCAADRQVRVFDINRGLSSDGMDEFRDKGCIRVFRCHRKRVKRIMAENSPDNFLSVAEVCHRAC